MRVITFNLRHDADQWEARLPLVIDTLHTEQADIIGFQEVHLPSQQAHTIARHLNARTPDQPYTVAIAPEGETRYHHGIGLLSRLPVLDSAELELPMTPRYAQYITVQTENGPVHIANTHLHHMPVWDEEYRLPQMEALVEWMKRVSDHGWILLGDMNAQPHSTTMLHATAWLASAFPTLLGMHPVTFPTPMRARWYPPGLACTPDHILFDAGHFQVTAARIIGNQPHPDDGCLYPSDHFGLAAELAFNHVNK